MGRRGSPPKSTHLKLLAGTFRKDRAKHHPQPQASPEVPTPPAFLGKTAKNEWRRVAPELHRLGLLTQLDRASFAAYCASYGRWVELEKIVTAQGMTFMTKRGVVYKRPEVTMAQKECALMRQFALEFGLTPTSRSRIEVPEPPKPDDDDWEFLFGKNRRLPGQIPDGKG